MAHINLTLKARAGGICNASVTEKLPTITIPGVTAAELEAGAATLHLPGEDPATGELLSVGVSKSLWIESIGATVEVDVTD